MISVILGTCTLDGRPLPAGRMEARLHRAVLPRTEWHSRSWQAGGVGLAACQPAESGKGAPELPARRRGCSIVWAGTLYNRRELRKELAETVEVAAESGDPGVALAAYEVWGPEFPERLLGEFSLVLWDEPRRRLVAARDALGTRDLFYRHEGDEVEVASQTALLHPAEGLSLDEVDLEYLADFLASHIVVGPRTPFRRIRRLPAAHVLVAEAGKVRIEPYWQLESPRSIHYRREEEYADGFRHYFFQAVERSLEHGGRVWAELSGGLDSSSIAVVAGHLLKEDSRLDHGFATVSRVWDESPDVDEREWAAPVAERLGLPWHQVRCDDLVFDGASEGARFRDDPHFGLLLHSMHLELSRLLQSHSVGALLSGARAEAVVLPEVPPPLHLADLLKGLQLRRLKSEAIAWQRTVQEPFANMLLRNCLAPALNPRRMRHFIHQDLDAQSWLDRRFVKTYRLEERARLGRMPMRFRLPTAQYHYELIGRSEPLVMRGYVPLVTEVLHPFLYRPLVEYSFAIPWEEKVRPGVHKWLLRRAMVGLLPEKVRRRGGKGGPGPAIYRSFPRHWTRLQPLVRDPLLAELGVFDRDAFRRTAELARLGSSKNFALFLGGIALEVWLRAVFQQQEPLRATA